ncbi:MAG TPA: 30S ribosomal protein S17 [Syntrophorhabdales bacterium]|nr:30S ribosomal protein S17 [Syntrophorhabdales bacterium]
MEPKSANRKKMVGLVVKDKMDKTVVVELEKRYKHGMYQKYLSTKTRCKAHDEKNAARVGDQVLLVETRPLSKEKRWVVKEVIRKAMAVPAIEVTEQ